MKRIRLPRTLPALTGALPAAHTQVHALLVTLRAVGQKLRGAEPQPFYTTREIAAHFGVPQPTVVQVYRQLEAEGLLVRLRSTGTLLQPRRRQSRTPVRGVVGIPIWLWGFNANPNWRTFYIALETHLRRHHFVADFVFYGLEPIEQTDLLDRLLAHQLDHLLWLHPLSAHIPLMQALADDGVRVGIVCGSDWRPAFPAYQVDWERPLARGLHTWARAGVRRLLVLHEGQDAFTRGRVLPLLEHGPLPFEWHAVTAADLGDLVQRWPRDQTWGAVIPSEDAVARWSASRPAELAELARRGRVLIRAPLIGGAAAFGDCHFDLLWTDWDQVAARVAHDIATNRWRPGAEPVLLSARWRSRVAAETLTRLI